MTYIQSGHKNELTHNKPAFSCVQNHQSSLSVTLIRQQEEEEKNETKNSDYNGKIFRLFNCKPAEQPRHMYTY